MFVARTGPIRRAARNGTRAAVARLLADGLSQTEIAGILGLSKPTVCYHARRAGVVASHKFSRRYDWPSVQRYYDQGHSLVECQAEFGFAKASWSQAIRRGAIVPRPRAMPVEELLQAGRRRNRFHVKGRLLAAGLLEARCGACGISEWRGRELPLELHHRNGQGDDNRLENLILLCANCHSQTDTWGGRNRGRAA